MTSAARPPGAPEPRRRSWIGRMFGRGRVDAAPQLVDDGTLQPLAEAFDPVRGDAAVVEELTDAGVDLTRPVLLRHVFAVLDGGDVEPLAGGLDADGYAVARPAPDRLTASATVLLTPMAAAQARARMTGLTTRHPVEYLGWEALGPDG